MFSSKVTNIFENNSIAIEKWAQNRSGNSSRGEISASIKKKNHFIVLLVTQNEVKTFETPLNLFWQTRFTLDACTYSRECNKRHLFVATHRQMWVALLFYGCRNNSPICFRDRSNNGRFKESKIKSTSARRSHATGDDIRISKSSFPKSWISISLRVFSLHTPDEVIQPTLQTQTETLLRKLTEKTNWLQLRIFISAPGTNLLRFTIRKIVELASCCCDFFFCRVRLLLFFLYIYFVFISFIFVVVSFIPSPVWNIVSAGCAAKTFGVCVGGDMCACMVRVQMRHAVNIEK